ncbi:hypothetical protein ACIBJI_40080 [Nocardia sp. NPDC050408]|uniref:hypothetical protein n=1 Tax=Nocardia sp. NPDC050408 TaxID=3364319 RepID=UPI0037973EC9
MTATGEREDRRGSLWTGEDYQEFFAALATTASDEQIAAQLGRTPGAVRSRAKFVLLDGYTGAIAMRKLREMVTQPGFDGEALAREAHAAAGYPFWDATTDEQLILAWAKTPPPGMASLVQRFGVNERDIARRCIRLGLAVSTAEVADHLGAEPGKVLDTWARMARESSSVAVGVLVVTSSEGTVLHLSLHTSIDAAAQACTELDESDLTGSPAVWTIATRIVGEGSIRDTATGVWAERHRLGETIESADEPATVAADPPNHRRQPWWRLFRR